MLGTYLNKNFFLIKKLFHLVDFFFFNLGLLTLLFFLFFDFLLLNKDGWQSRWVKSDWKKSEGKAGSFKHTAGKWSGDPDDKGIISLLFFDSTVCFIC